MLKSYIITINIDSVVYQIFVSPFSLHSKEQPKIKAGKIEKLFFYNNLKDADYEAYLKQNSFYETFNSNDKIINYGQDFEKYYLGSFLVDIDTKQFRQWEGNSGKFSAKHVKALADSLFNNSSNHKTVVLFTPTNPNEINLGEGPLD